MFISSFAGRHVEKTAQRIDPKRINTNSLYGNKIVAGSSINIDLWKLIENPTIVPINTPENDAATTKTKASYM